MQEKIVPLIKAVKTKEPAVMMAALDVMRVVGDNADAEFVAMEILPALWNMSLGPLLDLKQFQKFMELIKSLSRRVEDEQTKKLQELAVTNGTTPSAPTTNDDFLGFGGVTGTTFDAANGATSDDFERLVKGKTSQTSSSSRDGGWEAAANPAVASPTTQSSNAQFSWSTTTPTNNSPFSAPKAQPSFRTVTPDLAAFGTLSPQTTQFSQPLQPNTIQNSSIAQPASTGIGWSSTAAATPSPWASTSTSMPLSPGNSSKSAMTSSISNMNMNLNQQRPPINQSSSFSLVPPPSGGSTTLPGFRLPPPPTGGGQRQVSSPSISQASSHFGAMSPPAGSMNSIANPAVGSGNRSMNSMMGTAMNVMTPPIYPVAQTPQQQKQPSGGLDKYESLL